MAATTIGEAHDQGWRITVLCARDRVARRHNKDKSPYCYAQIDLDLATLVWTRGRAFPLSDIATRMKCIRCGARQVLVAYGPPAEGSRLQAQRAG